MNKSESAKRIFFIGDTHLGVRNNSEEWIEIMKDYFNNWFIPYIKKEYKPGDILVHLGDVFDSRQSLNLKVLNFGSEIIEKLSKIFIDGVYIIAGNHDCYAKSDTEINSINFLRWIPNVNIFKEPQSIKFGKRKAFLMPWRKDHAEERNCLNSAGNHDYLFCHTDIGGLMFNKYTPIQGGIESIDLDNFDRVYSGHIHYSQNKGKVRMVGSPYELTRSDANNKKHFLILDLETGDETFIENNFSPKFLRIPFTDVLNLTPPELDIRFRNNFIDVLVDPKLAVKAPLGILSEMITSQMKLGFTPISAELTSVQTQDDMLFQLDGRGFSLPDLVEEYVNGMDLDDKTKNKVKKHIGLLYDKITKQSTDNEN